MTDTQKEMLLKFELYLATTLKNVLDEKIKELESFNSTINIRDYFDNFDKNFNQIQHFMFHLPTKTELYNILLKQACEELRQCEEAVRELFKDEKYYEILQRLYYEYQLPTKFFYALQKDNVDLCNLQISLENGFYKIKYREVDEDQLENNPEYDENTFSITIYASGVITFDERNQPEFHKLSLYFN